MKRFGYTVKSMLRPITTAQHGYNPISFLRRHTLQGRDKGKREHTGMHQDHDGRLEPLPQSNEAKVTQDRKKQEEHIQQVTQQSATIITMVQEQ